MSVQKDRVLRLVGEAPIDGAELLTDTAAFLHGFVAYPSSPCGGRAHALIAHTHAMAWDYHAEIAVLSPEPASGKTRALEVSELLVPRAVERSTPHPRISFAR